MTDRLPALFCDGIIANALVNLVKQIEEKLKEAQVQAQAQQAAEAQASAFRFS